jgi:hypothetical protein
MSRAPAGHFELSIHLSGQTNVFSSADEAGQWTLYCRSSEPIFISAVTNVWLAGANSNSGCRVGVGPASQ